MTASTTNWSNCMYGGIPGGNGHRVPADQMSRLTSNRVTIRICNKCKEKRQERDKSLAKI